MEDGRLWRWWGGDGLACLQTGCVSWGFKEGYSHFWHSYAYIAPTWPVVMFFLTQWFTEKKITVTHNKVKWLKHMCAHKQSWYVRLPLMSARNNTLNPATEISWQWQDCSLLMANRKIFEVLHVRCDEYWASIDHTCAFMQMKILSSHTQIFVVCSSYCCASWREKKIVARSLSCFSGKAVRVLQPFNPHVPNLVRKNRMLRNVEKPGKVLW